MLREAVRQSPPTHMEAKTPQRTVRGEQQVTAVLIEGIVKTPVPTVVESAQIGIMPQNEPSNRFGQLPGLDAAARKFFGRLACGAERGSANHQQSQKKTYRQQFHIIHFIFIFIVALPRCHHTAQNIPYFSQSAPENCAGQTRPANCNSDPAAGRWISAPRH